jgi:hypothetical protein
MDARDTIRVILDADQGVCMDGHECHLIWLPAYDREWAMRTCNVTHYNLHDDSGVPMPYVGYPVIADNVTPEQIEAVRALDPLLAEWAEASIADRQ